MVRIEQYMYDGANWQAAAVLACLRSMPIENKYSYIEVGRCDNFREQGYVFRLCYKNIPVMCYWVCEHRNSDEIIVKRFDNKGLNTPSIDDIPMFGKRDYDKSFPYGDIVRCASYIYNDMNKLIISKIEEET